MARDPPSQKGQCSEREGELQRIVCSLGSGNTPKKSTGSMTPLFRDTTLAQQQLPGMSTSFFPSWNVPISTSRELYSDRPLFLDRTRLRSISSYCPEAQRPAFSTALDFTRDTHTECIEKHTIISHAPEILGFPRIDAGVHYTHCPREGMNMGVMDYVHPSRLIEPITHGLYPSFPRFTQQEISSPSILLFGPQESPLSSLSSLSQQERAASSAACATSGVPGIHSSVITEAHGGLSGAALPVSPSSSMSSPSRDGNRHKESSCASAIAVGTAEKKPGLGKPSEELVHRSTTKTVKKANKPRKKAQKRIREPRVALVTKSDVEHLEDGYRWRKYGQKAVKNSPYARSYYRCTHSKCFVKKRVERSSEDPCMVVTTYEGQHTHHSPAVLRASIDTQFTDPPMALFNQSAFSFPLPYFPMREPLSGRSCDHAADHLQGEAVRQPPAQLKSRHPVLQQSSQAMTDKGLLEDILPAGVRRPV